MTLHFLCPAPRQPAGGVEKIYQFVAALDNAETFGGTLALGVESGTTADFDSLIIRDTTPHGE